MSHNCSSRVTVPVADCAMLTPPWRAVAWGSWLLTWARNSWTRSSSAVNDRLLFMDDRPAISVPRYAAPPLRCSESAQQGTVSLLSVSATRLSSWESEPSSQSQAEGPIEVSSQRGILGPDKSGSVL